MMRLFAGYSDAYGTYRVSDTVSPSGTKVEIKSSASTMRGAVTEELWRAHLEGRQPLGIIPIRQDNTAMWGCVDVDTYDLDHLALVEACDKEGLPLLVCRSKSGGAHLFLFMKEGEAVSAEIMQMRLREMAALLGHGSAEVFPKQKTVALDRGDLGNWLNMPYFGGDKTDRYGVNKKGMEMSLSQFLARAETLRQPALALDREFRKKSDGAKDPDWGDGPPCMQHLAAAGYPEGMRNKGLFNLATFAKKKYGSRWVEVLERWNRDHFDPPLPTSEVMDIIKSQERKDYNYQCKEHPLVSHCNSVMCRMRKYGVGGDEDLPVLSGMSVLDTVPPLWFLDVSGTRIELTTEELQNYKAFHRICMERLHLCFRMMKQDTWLQVVGAAMKDAIRVEVSAEVSDTGTFAELLEDFCVNRHRGEQREDILVGRPWEDEDERRHYFRLRDLQRFLDSANFKSFTRAKIVSTLRDMGGGRAFFNIKGKGLNVWWVPSDFVPTPTLSVPKIEREPI